MTIEELMNKTMIRDPGNPNFVSFDSKKLEDEVEEEPICLHCLMKAQDERIEELEWELQNLKTRTDNFFKMLGVNRMKGLR